MTGVGIWGGVGMTGGGVFAASVSLVYTQGTDVVIKNIS